jgi:hypothetical protein
MPMIEFLNNLPYTTYTGPFLLASLPRIVTKPGGISVGEQIHLAATACAVLNRRRYPQHLGVDRVRPESESSSPAFRWPYPCSNAAGKNHRKQGALIFHN